MEIIDIAILILLGLGAFEGYRKGFLLGVLGLFGFVIAIVLGIYFMSPANDWFLENVTEFNIGYPVMGFLVVFFITLVLIKVVGWVLKSMMNLVLLGGIDSLVGALFGALKAAFFISLFLWQANLFKLDLPKEWVKKSEILVFVEPIAPAIVGFVKPFLPSFEGILENLEEVVDKIKDDSTSR